VMVNQPPAAVDHPKNRGYKWRFLSLRRRPGRFCARAPRPGSDSGR
jgi:hypothetical protein